MALDVGGAASGAAMGSQIMPGWGTAIGAGLGAMGLFGKKAKKAKPLKQFEQKDFTGVGGTTTATGFTAAPQANEQANADLAGEGLNTTLQQGFAVDPAMQQKYQDAFVAGRSPEMERGIQNRQQSLDLGKSLGGVAHSSGNIYAQSLANENADRARSQLTADSIAGGRSMALQDTQARQQAAGAYGALQQQFIDNQANAQAGGINAYTALNTQGLNTTNQNNAATQGQFLNQQTNNANARQGTKDNMSGLLALGNAGKSLFGGGGLGGDGGSGGSGGGVGGINYSTGEGLVDSIMRDYNPDLGSSSSYF